MASADDTPHLLTQGTSHRFAEWPLWRQVALVLAFATVITLVVGGFMLTKQMQEDLLHQSNEDRQIKMGLIRTAVLEALITEDIPVLESSLAEVADLEENILTISLVNEQGENLVQWRRDASLDVEATSMQISITYAGELFGSLEVYWNDTQLLDHVRGHVASTNLLYSSGLLLMALLVFYLLNKLTIKPLGIITRRVNEIANGDLDGQLPRSTSRELSLLSVAINDLGGALIESSQSHARLVRTSASLEHLKTRNELVLNSAGEGIIGLDANGSVEFINDTALQLIGCSRNDVLGLSVLEVVHLGRPEEIQATEEDAALLDAIEKGHVRHMAITTFWRWNRKPFPVEYTSTPILMNRRVEGAVVVFRNIIERRRLEEEQRLAAITFNTKEAMMVTDAQGTIMRVNKAFTEVSGFGAQDAIGLNAGFQKSGRHDEAFYAELWKSLNDSGHWEGEIWNRRKNGEIYPLWYSITAVRDDVGDITHYVSHATDISQIKQTETELREAIAKAEAANQAKAGFLATMSHEMRTPLNAVLGMLGLLQDANLAPRLRDYVHTAREAGEGLLELISDILDFSKMDAGKFELENEPFDSTRLLGQVSALLKQRADEKGLHFKVSVDEAGQAVFRGDAGRLRQVLLNLAGNAIKFTEQGEVGLELVVTPIDGDRHRLDFSVADTGIGIPEARQADLFSEFTTLDATYARRYGGAGLGLAISRRLVEMMGGEMGYSSREGQGSRFWFKVELEACELPTVRHAGGSTARKAPVGRSARILLAEDVAANRKLAKELLQRAGHTVDAVSDGGEAVTAVSGFPYDLVLMDISMPMVDGLEATRRIRALPDPLCRIPIIAMTAHAMTGDRESFLAAGMDDYLQKPVNNEALLDVVARWSQGTAGVRLAASVSDQEPPPGGETPARPSVTLGVDAVDLVDPETLAQLGRDTDPDLVSELVGLFIDDARGRVERIASALDEGDMATIDHEVHALGSSSATYGLPAMHRLARRCEEALRESDEVQGRELAAALVDSAAEAFDALERHAVQATDVPG
jgi:PAS domain S-box-containing protein